MNVYTYSEARQNLSSVLNKAKTMGKVLIKRKDGSSFVIIPETKTSFPFDVPSLKSKVSKKDILDSIRESRER